MNSAPKKKIQKESALRRGNATSRAPIWSGTMKLKNATAMGIPTRNTMVVPCMVNSWLYVSAVTKWFSGRDSCMRISRASMPPTRKKTSAVRPYITPIFL